MKACLLHINLCCLLFLTASFENGGHGVFAAEERDVITETTIRDNIKHFISNEVSAIAQSNADEIKALKALIESQANLIEILSADKLKLYSEMKNMEKRIKDLETKDFPNSKLGTDKEQTGSGSREGINDVTSHDVDAQNIQVANDRNRRGMQAKVAFFARIKTTQQVAQDQIVVFDDVMTNVGISYNGSSGQFVVPLKGVYILTLTIGAEFGDDTSARLVVNGKQIVMNHVNEEQSSQTIILILNAGDVVALHNAEAARTFTANGYNSFGGFILYDEFPYQQITVG